MITDKKIQLKHVIKQISLTGDALKKYEEFIRQMQEIYNKNYGDIDTSLLPVNDKKLLLDLFEFHINNVGNPDGNCQYGLATRGFELKLLNQYFNMLNTKPYGEKYGEKGTVFYNDNNNPDPDNSFGYFTLGQKEAALWAFKAAKTLYQTEEKKQPVLIAYNKLPISILDAAYLLSIKKGQLQNIKATISEDNNTAIVVISLTQDISERELSDIEKYIRHVREVYESNCFIHVVASSIIDILKLSQGYNIFIKDSPKFYAFPAQPVPSKYSGSGNFYVDTVSISNTSDNYSSFMSGTLLTTTRNQKYFNSATVPYIGAEDSTAVGSSNGDFLLIDYYFNQRFPLSTLHMLKGKDRKQLSDYMSQQELSDSERHVYTNLIGYLTETRPNSMGYPINQLWDDRQLNGLFELLIKEKLIYNTGRNDMYADLSLSQSINPKTGNSFVEEFEEEILSFYKREVFFPHDNPDKFDGYITTGGTEGNYTGLFIAHKLFGENAVLFLTNESHYSVSKGASIFGIATQKVNVTDDESGNMDCEDLEYKIKVHKKNNPNVKIIVNANIATTLKGSIDSIKGIKAALDNCRISEDSFWLHCDGALQGNVFPFLPIDAAKEIVPFILNPQDPDYVAIDSIAVSGHKFIGAPFPCGITLFRKIGGDHYKKTIIDEIKVAMSSAADLYNTSELDVYMNQNSIISGTRNYYMSVVIWKRIKELGREGFEMLVNHCEEMTQYAESEFKKNMVNTGIKPFRNKNCNIVTLTPPPSQYVLNKYNLPTDEISHIDIMPHIDREQIDSLIKDMIAHPIDIKATAG